MKTNKLSMNVFTLLLVTLFLVVLVNDYMTYFFSVPYLFSLLLSVGIAGFLFYFLKKQIRITLDFHKADILFYLFLGAIFLITIVYPDIAFDSVNYHIYLQEHPFGDKIFSDFFAGKNLNTFSYAFPDRVHYVFRFFLGFRLGVICNYLVLIVLFYQIKEILKLFIKNKNELCISIFSMLTVFSLSIIELVDNYYIDLFSLVTLLEIVRMLLKETFVENKKYLLLKTSYFALLFGFAVAIKISNLPLLAFFFLVFLFKTKFSFHKLSGKLVVAILGFGVLPFGLYFLYTYLKTCNPVFPFYNTIFKSPYYSLSNWMDTRFGPHGILETFIWPIKIYFAPNLGVDSSVVELFWMMGYILSFVYLLYYSIQWLKKRQVDKEKVFFFLLVLFINLIWSKFLLGYTRYGLLVLLLSSVCFFIAVFDMYKKKWILPLGVLAILWCHNFAYSGYHFLFSKEHWLFNNKYQQDRGTDYFANVKKMFTSTKTKIELPDQSIWGIINYNAAYATMVNQNAPLVNLNASVSNAETEEILNQHTKGKRIFSMTDVLNFQNFFTYLNEAGYYISSSYHTYNPNFLRYRERLYVFEIEKKEKKNTYSGVNTVYTYMVENPANTISFIAGVEKSLVEQMQEGYVLEVKKVHNGKEALFDYIELKSDGELVNYRKNISLEKGDQISITILDKNKKAFLDDRWFMLINFLVEK